MTNLIESYTAYFNAKPQFIARAPGRVNLIGEHTDYNGGFVLPMAIEQEVSIALVPRLDSTVRLFSLDLDLIAQFELGALLHGDGWDEYPKGVADELLKAGFRLNGFDGVITGNVPRGAGLSSSAAVELAVARAFCASSNFEWDAVQMATICQKAENHWVGVQCGIMDQMASAASRKNNALFLDCKTLAIQNIPMPANIAVVVMDTSTRRGLVASAYNERRRQCEESARDLNVEFLRDVSWLDFQNNIGKIKNPDALKRARHIISENERVLNTVDAMRSNDPFRMGKLFNESHISLRDDFEVTNDALNQIVESAWEQDGCFGARMTGAGFGGCAVALVEKEKARAFAQAVGAAYKHRCGLEALVYLSKASDGASISKC